MTEILLIALAAAIFVLGYTVGCWRAEREWWQVEKEREKWLERELQRLEAADGPA